MVSTLPRRLPRNPEFTERVRELESTWRTILGNARAAGDTALADRAVQVLTGLPNEYIVTGRAWGHCNWSGPTRCGSLILSC